jgi:hypothetical protein
MAEIFPTYQRYIHRNIPLRKETRKAILHSKWFRQAFKTGVDTAVNLPDLKRGISSRDAQRLPKNHPLFHSKEDQQNSARAISIECTTDLYLQNITSRIQKEQVMRGPDRNTEGHP